MIPAPIETQLRSIAEKAAGKYTDPLLDAMGWTRAEYVDAILIKLRTKWIELRRAGQVPTEPAEVWAESHTGTDIQIPEEQR